MTPDEQEAQSRRYAARQYILRLKSGNYAVIGCYDYTAGCGAPVLFIGSWAECEPYVQEFIPPPLPVLKTKLSHLELDLDLRETEMTAIEKLNILKDADLNLELFGNSINSNQWYVSCSGERDGVKLKVTVKNADFTLAIEELYEKFKGVATSGLSEIMRPVIAQAVRNDDNLPF